MGILRVVQLSTLVFKQDIKLQDNQRKKTWEKKKKICCLMLGVTFCGGPVFYIGGANPWNQGQSISHVPRKLCLSDGKLSYKTVIIL